jgi:hypothetical protein
MANIKEANRINYSPILPICFRVIINSSAYKTAINLN